MDFQNNEVNGSSEVVVNPTSEQRKQKFGAHMAKKGKSMWKCLTCGKTAGNSFNMIKHVENSHMRGVFGYHCSHCSDVMDSYMSFESHKKRKHSFV